MQKVLNLLLGKVLCGHCFYRAGVILKILFMRNFFFPFFFFFITGLFAQMQDEAIIKPKELPVLDNKTSGADTIYALRKDEVFLLTESYDIDTCRLYNVEIAKDFLCKKEFFPGYVPKTQIILVDSLTKYSGDYVGLKFVIEEVRIDTTKNSFPCSFGLFIEINYTTKVKAMYLKWGDIKPSFFQIFKNFLRIKSTVGTNKFCFFIP